MNFVQFYMVGNETILKKKKRAPLLPPLMQKYLLHIQLEGCHPTVISKRKKYIKELYTYLSQELNILESNLEKNLSELNLKHLEKYEEHIDQSGQVKRFPLFAVEKYMEYLFNNRIVNFHYRRQNHSKRKSSIPIPPVVDEFIIYLTNKNYGSLVQHRKAVMSFFSFLTKNFPEYEHSKINQTHIKKYEHFLGQRIIREEITPASVYQYLRSIRLYVEFLYSKKLIKFTYEIPKHFIAQGKRSNEYIPKEDVIYLLKALTNFPQHFVRNLAILLLLFETGCRPIEICNLKMSDIKISESMITLYSKKSGQRKLKINHVVLKAIKNYISLRSGYNVDHGALFLKGNFEPLTVKAISHVIAKANEIAFGKILYSPKTFRHTFATNALDNFNDFDQVSKSMGHKNWVSTMYYLHRSHKRLLTNTLLHDPTTFVKGGNS